VLGPDGRVHAAIGKSTEFGSLAPGMAGNATILDLDDGRFCDGGVRLRAGPLQPLVGWGARHSTVPAMAF
jgi:hypothetical protein